MGKRFINWLCLGAAFIAGAYSEAGLNITPTFTAFGKKLYGLSLQYLSKIDVTGWIILAGAVLVVMASRRMDRVRGG